MGRSLERGCSEWERAYRSKPIARNAEPTVRRPGARIAPTNSTWACCQTRLENSGAKEANTCTISWAVGYATRSPLLAEIGDESVPYPFPA